MQEKLLFMWKIIALHPAVDPDIRGLEPSDQRYPVQRLASTQRDIGLSVSERASIPDIDLHILESFSLAFMDRHRPGQLHRELDIGTKHVLHHLHLSRIVFTLDQTLVRVLPRMSRHALFDIIDLDQHEIVVQFFNHPDRSVHPPTEHIVVQHHHLRPDLQPERRISRQHILWVVTGDLRFINFRFSFNLG